MHLSVLNFNSVESFMTSLRFGLYKLSPEPLCIARLFLRERLRTHSIESSGKLKISPEQHWDFTAEDLKDLGEIGRGAYGSVNKMVHKPSQQIMAVKVRHTPTNISSLLASVVPCGTLNIHGIFPFQKRFFRVLKCSH